jgi:YesN/AraC family two-component response regulator
MDEDLYEENNELFEKKSAEKPQLLIIEDNDDLRMYLVKELGKSYQIHQAEDGKSGLSLARDLTPDLIVSDIVMPKLDGIELCKEVKSDIRTSHIPVILLTAKSSVNAQIEGTKTGADAYLTKPFNIELLHSKIEQLIHSRRKLFKQFSQEAYILPKELSNNKLDQHFLEKIIYYIEDKVNKTDLSVEDLASYLAMSKGHTWRKVKSLTGLTTNEFIRTVKLKKAVKIMEESNLNISEIAYRVGFSSPAYFTKCFRMQYGKSPTAFLSDRTNPDN